LQQRTLPGEAIRSPSVDDGTVVLRPTLLVRLALLAAVAVFLVLNRPAGLHGSTQVSAAATHSCLVKLYGPVRVSENVRGHASYILFRSSILNGWVAVYRSSGEAKWSAAGMRKHPADETLVRKGNAVVDFTGTPARADRAAALSCVR
jgi:hypothetical protein